MTSTKKFNYTALETERVNLKVLSMEDAFHVYNHFKDEAVTRFMDIEPCKDIKEAEEIINYHLEDSGCRWGLFTKSNAAFIGTCGFHYLRNKNGSWMAEVGFDLTKTHWGKGYMKEVMCAIIDFGFTKMELDIIDATVEPENERSIKLMESLGFKKEHELKDNLIYFYLIPLCS